MASSFAFPTWAPHMRRVLLSLSFLGCAQPGSGTDHEIAFQLETGKLSGLPAGWLVAGASPTTPCAGWQVVADPRGPAQHQVLAVKPPEAASGPFNLCWTNEVPFKDGALEVALCADAGRQDQGGGPIWRVRDAANYYVCRINPLEGNFRVYVVEHGERRELGSADVDVATGTWHTIRIEHAGTRIRCWIDGAAKLEVTDSTLRDSGGVGVWSKADAATHFADLRVFPIR